MFEVRHNGVLYAIGGNLQDIKGGWQFPGPTDTPLQWGMLEAPPGMELKAHRHLTRERIPVHKTQEFLFIIHGEAEAVFLDEAGEPFHRRIVCAGDFLCLYDGAHGFKVGKQENFQMIEVKNGPYVPVEQDKVRL